jgi:hypothetical protein
LKADCGEEGENWKYFPIAEAFHLSLKTVERVRKSLVKEGFEGTINRKLLLDSHRERVVKEEKEAYLLALTGVVNPQRGMRNGPCSYE